MILDNYVEVKCVAQNVKYYESLGYEIPRRWNPLKYKYTIIPKSTISVKVSDLSVNSGVIINALCDICNKNTKKITMVKYNRYTNNQREPFHCKECAKIKRANTNLKKYGYPFVIMNPEIREKMENTMFEKYGVRNPSQSEYIQNKKEKTYLEKYGVKNPMMLQEIREKAYKTTKERYGFEHALQNKEFYEKSRQTCFLHYGYYSPLLVPENIKKAKEKMFELYGVKKAFSSKEIQEKAMKALVKKYGTNKILALDEIKIKCASTMYKNGTVPSSRQQRYICNIYNGILNYPIKMYNLDIYLKNDNLGVEVNFSGHDLCVQLGNITQEDFDRSQLIRDIFIKRQDIKLIKIISKKDYVPPDYILLQMLCLSKKYFYNFPNHSWITFDIDNGKMFNAENKKGVLFNFGNLRKIKK